MATHEGVAGGAKRPKTLFNLVFSKILVAKRRF